MHSGISIRGDRRQGGALMPIPLRVVIAICLLALLTVVLALVLIAIIDPSFFPGIWHSINFGRNPLEEYP